MKKVIFIKFRRGKSISADSITFLSISAWKINLIGENQFWSGFGVENQFWSGFGEQKERWQSSNILAPVEGSGTLG